jgi:hypothetical protein
MPGSHSQHALPAALVFACLGASVSLAAENPPESPPEIGTKMPDGTVYAGLSMDTGKPSYVRAAGGKMPDGTVYAGVSPDTGQDMYTTPRDAPALYAWDQAAHYCKRLSAAGHHDWRVPTTNELATLFANRADIGAFNQTGYVNNQPGYYWSSLATTDQSAWGQRFNDGYHEDLTKDHTLLLRCVRS